MVLPPNEALQELNDIRTELEQINLKKYGFWKARQKQKDIRKLVDKLDIVLHSSDPDYTKGDVINNAPDPIKIVLMGEETEMEATSKAWYQYLSHQLDLYQKRFQLLAKSPTETSRNRTFLD